MIDVANLTFAGIVTIGAVNVITFFVPNLNSQVKWVVSLLVAFGLTFVPATWGTMLSNHIKEALEIAFLASGGYKIAQKIGGQ